MIPSSTSIDSLAVGQSIQDNETLVSASGIIEVGFFSPGNSTRRQETDVDSVLWQSFDYPCDTWMSGMKIGWNLVTGLERYVSSWKSVDDPAEGEYAYKMDRRGYRQIVKFKGHGIKMREGSWNGLSLVGNPGPTNQLSLKFVFNEKEVYFEYVLLNRSFFDVVTLTPSGAGQILFWSTHRSTRQLVFSSEEKDQCESYAFRGTNSICNYNANSPSCECLRGYIPKYPDQWNVTIWLDGCVPRNKSNCNNEIHEMASEVHTLEVARHVFIVV
ncbi:hypothetical protein Fmac_021228 [Flemingia macrophylla]|uniref:Uncharacterized protein n=1 Tax=Flemingia macrophylla TaxID=520843 RepID=A0ABD1LWF7_9FABA